MASLHNMYYTKCRWLLGRGLFIGVWLGLALLLLSCSGARQKIAIREMVKDFTADIGGVRLDSIKLEPNLHLALQVPGTATGIPKQWQALNLIQELATGKLQIRLGTAHLQTEILVRNPHQDTLWVQGLQGSVALDTLLQSPVGLALPPVALAPGVSSLWLSLQLTLDERLLQIRTLERLHVQGVVHARQSRFKKPVEITVDHTRKIPPAIAREILSKAKEMAIKELVDGWVRSMLE